MAAFGKILQFTEDLAKKVHDLSSDTFKVVLTNTWNLNNAVLADVTQIANGNGYTTGGESAGTPTAEQAIGVLKFTLDTDPVWTASGGTIGPFRYAVLYNDTPTSPADPLIGYWDYGAAGVTLQIGDTFTVDLDQANGVLTVT